ncbi:MAG: hypothetical protein JO352_22110 [Chloroflexi bacterium]|nr:hypothetical protein [Chloroflexota bacterium]MBV9597114.1 hypothetical protein [Chloroflexota bacterium]
MQAEHVTADDQRTPGIVGFDAEDHFIQTLALINESASRNPDGTIKSISYSSNCNTFPLIGDATCTSNGFIWLHGNYAPDVDKHMGSVRRAGRQ